MTNKNENKNDIVPPVDVVTNNYVIMENETKNENDQSFDDTTVESSELKDGANIEGRSKECDSENHTISKAIVK